MTKVFSTTTLTKIFPVLYSSVFLVRNVVKLRFAEKNSKNGVIKRIMKQDLTDSLKAIKENFYFTKKRRSVHVTKVEYII